MGDVGQLGVSVKVDESSLKNATQKIQDSFTNTGDKIEKTLNKSLLGGIQAFAGTQIASGLNKVAGWALTLAGNLQQADVAFTTMLGSAEASKKMLKDLSDFASRTPFELTGIRQTAKQLIAYGVEAEKILPTLKSLGDVSAGLSVPIEQVAYAYGQVRSAGRLLGQDLRQFTNAGVPIIAELAKNLGVAESGIKDMVSAGKIGFADVEKAFQTMSGEGGKFANLMDKQSKTLLGSWSNFKDAMNTLGEVLGGLFTDSLTGVVTAITGVVNSIKDWSKEHPVLAKSIATIVFVFGGLLSIIGMVAGAIALLTPLFIGTAGIITAVAGGVALLTGAFTLMTGASNKSAKSLSELKDQFDTGKVSIEEYMQAKKELTEKIQKNREELEKLTQKYTLGQISMVDYMKEVERLKKEYDKLTGKTDEASMATDTLTKMITEFYDRKGDTKQKRDELEKLRKQILANIDANIALLESEVYVEKAKTTQGQGAVAPMYGELIDNIKIAGDNADKLLNKLDTLKARRKEIQTAVIGGANDTAGGSTNGSSGSGGVSDATKQLLEDQGNLLKDRGKEIQDAFELSNKNIEEYKKNIKDIGKEFTDMANTAKDELWHVNQSLSQLSSDYASNQGTRYAEVLAQLATAESGSAEWSKLEQERQYLIGITTQAVRDQAVEYYNLSEAQKTTKKYEEDKLALLEKQALLTAISQQTTGVDANGNTILDQKLRVTEANQFEYEAEKGKWVAITDAKNIEYARDQLNKQMKNAQDILDNQTKLDAEYVQQEDLNTKKMTLEADFTKFVNEQTTAQRKVVKGLIDDVQTAINMINQLNALNARSKTSSSKGFMAGGYTGDGPISQVKGVVHAGEYVIPQAVLASMPSIVPMLEAVRTGQNIDNSRNVSMGSVIVQNQMDFEQLLDRIRFMHL